MYHKIYRKLVIIIGDQKINECIEVAGNLAVCFISLKKESWLVKIEKAIKEKQSNSYISKHLKVKERTMRRYRSNSCLKN
jgi:hypothetical protein